MGIQLPSLDYIFKKSSNTLKRFPLAIASASLAVFTAIYLSELSNENLQASEHLFRLIMVSVLGISLFTVITLSAEKKSWSRPVTAVVQLAGAAVLILYFFLLPHELDNVPDNYIFRYILYFLAAHLLVAVGPYWGRGEMSGFWQYNKTLFLRFLTAVLFSAVLYIGLIVALGSIDVLLDIDIDESRYFQLFILIGGVFNTWFFLAGIPKSLDTLDHIDAYPKGLKIFTQNILIPLVVIYLVILYLYMGKIIIEWSWPEGWVGYLVLSFSIVGIFALLLLHPIQEKAENRWIKRFSRSYFIVLVPLVILLLLAIWRRIEEYSFTVNRYFVLVLGLWLAGIVVYFIASKTKNIKVIPASLGLIAFLISFGPWGAFSVAEHSQLNRLEHYLEKNEILANGTVTKVSEPVSFEDSKEISSILRYLNDMHGLEGIQPWFEEDLSELKKPAPNSDTTMVVSRYEKPQFITEMMGIQYVNQWESEEEASKYRQFTTGQNGIMDISDYEWLVDYQYYQGNEKEKQVILGNNAINIRVDTELARLAVTADSNPQDSLYMELNPLIESLSKQYRTAASNTVPPEEMSVTASNETMRVKIYISNLNISLQEEDPRLRNITGKLLISSNE